MAKKLTLPFTTTGWVTINPDGTIASDVDMSWAPYLPQIYRTRSIAAEDVSLWDGPPKPVRVRITIEEFHK